MTSRMTASSKLDHIGIHGSVQDVPVFEALGYSLKYEFDVNSDLMFRIFSGQQQAHVFRLSKDGEPDIELFTFAQKTDAFINHLGLLTDKPGKLTQSLSNNDYEIVEIARQNHTTFFAKKDNVIFEYKQKNA